MDTAPAQVTVALDAVIMAVSDRQPRLLVVGPESDLPVLPAGPLDPRGDATLELGLRRCVVEQTGLEVGYVEQLYTFGDRGRRPDAGPQRQLSVAYLALVREAAPPLEAGFLDVYELFPWEDHRNGEPAVLGETIRPALARWAGDDPDRRERVATCLGPPWDGIRVLERYELLYSAGLVDECALDAGQAPAGRGVGRAMRFDHRRIAATALGRLRGKLTYRPVVFELLPERFTLLELQRTVEALAGTTLHKQNFRRLVERTGLVEGTGERVRGLGGRPAELFRYRPAVLTERPRPGVTPLYR
jgi:hypothetical protein